MTGAIVAGEFMAFPTIDEAKGFADRIHKWMIANNYVYAHSAAYPWNLNGRGVWAIPEEATRANGEAEFRVPVDQSCMAALTEREHSLVKKSP